MTQDTDAGRDRWRATTRAGAMRGQTERREAFLTTSDVPISDLYTPADVADLDEDRDLGRTMTVEITCGPITSETSLGRSLSRVPMARSM